MDRDFVIDDNLNFSNSLKGYPNVQQFGNYNEKLIIDNEVPASSYKRTSTDDLSHVWKTNNLDNMDDLNKVLRDADVNAFDTDFYGAKGLNVVTENTDFSKVLKLDQQEPCAPKSIQVRNVESDSEDYSDEDDEDEYTDDSNTTILWLLLLIFVSMLVFSCTGGSTNILVDAYNKSKAAVESMVS